MTGHDVFVSYHGSDRQATERLARTLAARGLQVFLDRWFLAPGQPWPTKLEEVIRTCRSVIVCIGPGPRGSWQEREIYLALARQTKEPGFPVIPVLLPGADSTLGFLGHNTRVDLRPSLDDPLSLEVLWRAVRGDPPGPDIEGEYAKRLPPVCPYRRLEPFREEHAAFFHGREEDARKLANLLAHRRLIAVVGASGSGKSSVVRAGLVPALRQGGNEDVWEIAVLEPGDEPFHALSAALLPLLDPELSEVGRLAEIRQLANDLDQGRTLLRDIVKAILAKQPGTTRLLLVVDQWEQLAASDAATKNANRVVDALLDAISRTKLSVALTLRADRFGMLAYRPLADALDGAIHTLGTMRRAELEQAIEKPAARVGLTFEGGLVDRILDEVGDEPGNLPLLEFLLSELWERRRGNVLQGEAYDEIGGVRGALARSAERLVERLGPQREKALSRVMTRLVRASDEGPSTRRRARLGDLAPAGDIVSALAQERLVVIGRDLANGQETAEIAHEALIRHWDRLRSWIDDDREFLLWRDRLRGTRDLWERSARDPRLLLRDPLLGEAESWLDRRGEDMTEGERSFVAAGIAQRQHDADESRHRQEAELNRLETERDRARRAQAYAESLSALAQIRYVAERDPTIAAVALAELLETGRTPEGVEQLIVTLGQAWFCRVRLNHDGPLEAFHASADGQRLLIGGRRAAWVWTLDGRPLAQHEGELWIEHSDLSRDGKQLLVAGIAGLVVHGIDDGRSVRLSSDRIGSGAVNFSADGGSILVMTSDRLAILATDGSRVTELQKPPSSAAGASGERPALRVKHGEISPDGTRVAAVFGDGSAHLWSSDGRVIASVGDGNVEGLLFNPAGDTLVTRSRLVDRGLQSWTREGRFDWWPATGSAGNRFAVFDCEGLRLATGSWTGAVGLWAIRPGSWQRLRSRLLRRGWPARALPGDDPMPIAELMRGQTGVRFATFAAKENRVATGGEDGVLRIFDGASGRPLWDLNGHARPLAGATFANGDACLITCDDSAELRLWEIGCSLPVTLGASKGGSFLDGAFSPDGTKLALAGPAGVAVSRFDGAGNLHESILLARVASKAWPSGMLFSPDGSRLLVRYNDRSAALHVVAERRPIELEGSGKSIEYAAFSRDGMHLVTGWTDGRWVLYDREGRVLAERAAGEGALAGAGFSADGRRIVTWSSPFQDAAVRVWSLDGTALIEYRFDLTSEFHRRSRAAPALNPRRPFMAVAHPDGIALCDLRTSVQRNVPLENAHNLTTLIFDPAGRNLLAADGDSVRILTIGGLEQARIRATTGRLERAAFSPDGSRILTQDSNGLATLWNAEGGRLAELTRGPSRERGRIELSPDGEWLLALGSPPLGDRLWPIGQAAFRRRVRELTTVCLTPGERQRLLLEPYPTAYRRWVAGERGWGRDPSWLRDWAGEPDEIAVRP